jgi:hypothetical protein
MIAVWIEILAEAERQKSAAASSRPKLSAASLCCQANSKVEGIELAKQCELRQLYEAVGRERGKGVTATSAWHRKGISQRWRRPDASSSQVNASSLSSNPSPCVRRLQGLQKFDDGVLIRAVNFSANAK